MSLKQLLNILKLIRDFLFSTFNKEFVIFLFFLVLSSVYWLMSVLNDTMEREVAIRVQLTDIPRNVVVIDDQEIEVHAVLRDKGYTLASYIFMDRVPPVKVAFPTYARQKDCCVILASEMQKLIAQQLYASTRVVAVKPDKIEFHYNFGLSRRFPVKLLGTVRPGETYYLSHVKFMPDSVTVYGSSHVLDSIKQIYTVRQNITDFTDTIHRKVKLQPIPKVKIVPSEVTMTLCPDIMTEAVVYVPVVPINVPENMTLRTFPAQVQVKYVVGASQYNHVDTAAFAVVADYKSTENGTAPKCAIRLTKNPIQARNPVLLSTQVDYLIEQ